MIKTLLDAGHQARVGARRVRRTSASTSTTDIAVGAPRDQRQLGRCSCDGDELIDVLRKRAGRAQRAAAGRRQGRGRRPAPDRGRVTDGAGQRRVPAAGHPLDGEPAVTPSTRRSTPSTARSAPGWCRSAAGTCRSSTRRHDRRAPGVPPGGSRVRRVAPRHRARRRRRTRSTACRHAHQRPRQDRARAGAVHPPARRRRRARCSTTSSCGGTRTTTGEPCST